VSVVDVLFPRLHDKALGPIRYAWGRWTGDDAALFGHQHVRVRAPGTRQGLGAHVRPLLAQVAAAYPHLRGELLSELYSEFDSARESLGDEIPEDIRSTTAPLALWPHVTLARVWVGAYGIPEDVELAYRLAWDVEHTRGLTIADGALKDYCGSVASW
jgi:hypothetical protein